MDIKIRQDDSLRIHCDHEERNFIDVQKVGYDSMCVDMFPTFHYIEVREKENRVRIFNFPKKSYKKECDFGWWEDAEVVFSINKVINKIH